MHIYDVDETPGNHEDDDGNFGKTIVFTSKTTALNVHHAFLYVRFMDVHCTNTTCQPPNTTFYGVCEHTRTNQFPLSFNLDKVIKNSTLG